MHRKNIGDNGEQIAVDYLLATGFEVLHRNYRTGRLEIDIIAASGQGERRTLHFIEVKTRTCAPHSIREFSPEAAMTAAKKERIIRAAEAFIEENGHTGESFLGLVAINLSEGEYELRYYPDVRWA